jgi:hypothetical protein
MKKTILSVVSVVTFLFLSSPAYAIAQEKLADIYRTGTVHLVREAVIDETTLPKEIFLGLVSRVAVDKNKDLYALDYKEANVKKFDASGKFVRVIGGRGQGPGEFTFPSLIACSGERFIVWDTGARRFSLFKLSGEFVKSTSFPTLQNAMKIRGLPEGQFIVEVEKIYFDPRKPQDSSLVVFSSDMEPVKTIFQHPVWKNIFGLPKVGNIVQPFPAVVIWDVTPEGNLAVGFSEKYEIEILDRNGVKRTSFSHAYRPVEVTKEDRDSFLKNLIFTTKTTGGAETRSREVPDYVKEYAKFPAYKPAYARIAVDSEGNILVFPRRKERKEEMRVFDAFSPQGDFIGSVRVDHPRAFPGETASQIVDRCFWQPDYDKEGNVTITKYRISG